MSFAKIFDTKPYGQVLIKLDTDECGSHELLWYVQPPNMGVCTMGVSFSGDEFGMALAKKAFLEADEDQALEAARIIFGTAHLPPLVPASAADRGQRNNRSVLGKPFPTKTSERRERSLFSLTSGNAAGSRI